jgi:hypothetical protein
VSPEDAPRLPLFRTSGKWAATNHHQKTAQVTTSQRRRSKQNPQPKAKSASFGCGTLLAVYTNLNLSPRKNGFSVEKDLC